MNRIVRMICALCALSMFGFSVWAEEMPIVTDTPYSEEELAAAADAEAERVRQAQQMLIDLGILTGRADGISGPRTTAALESYQASQGLEVTGELDDATFESLCGMSDTLRDAETIQQRLIDLRYLRGKADGIFGEHSQAALKLFQTLNDLEVTGRADETTRERLFAEDAAVLPQRLTGGDKGEEVEALQKRLIQFGFLSTGADGSYGKDTAAAGRRLQTQLQAQGYGEEIGIGVTGEASSGTLALLYDPEYSSYIHDISPGDEGDEVLRVERRLDLLGYMDMAADEVFDDYAAAAAEAFRADAGLAQGGIDRAFIDALFAEDAPKAEHYVLHDIAVGDRGLAVREAEEALVCLGMTIRVPCGKYDDDLRQAVGRLHGCLARRHSHQADLFADPSALSLEAQQVLKEGLLAGETIEAPGQVTRIQNRLHTLYFLSKSDIDGVIGENSAEALKAFQQANGLEATGEADAATLQVLFSKDAVCNRRPYRVEVDIDSQRVYVFQLNEDGAYEQVKTFICSTGVHDSTPRGIYLDGFPVNYWHHFTKYDVWARYSFLIEGIIMFHSVLFREDNESTLKEGSLYALGQKASHGCVRLKVSDAEWLFNHCKRGTLVILIY